MTCRAAINQAPPPPENPQALRVRFRGVDYLLVGDLAGGGAIATVEEYTTFRPCHAWLDAAGRILRHHQQIGVREDLEVLGESDAAPTPEAVAAALRHLLGLLGP